MRSINLTMLILTLMAILAFGAAGTNVLSNPTAMADMTASAALPL